MKNQGRLTLTYSRRTQALRLAFGVGLCLWFSVAGWAQAQKLKFPAYTAHVNDFANVMDAASKKQLETILTNFERLTNTQIAVATVPSLQDRPIEDYANELYRAWGIGAKSGQNKDKGALLLVAPTDRKSRLEVGYGLEGDLPDGLAGEQLRRMRPYFQQGQYSQGLTVGVRTLVDTLAEKWNVNVEGIDKQYAYHAPAPQEAELSPGALICFLIAILLFFAMLFFAARRGGGGSGGTRARRSDWYAAPIVFNSGGGDFGSGSWGSSGGWGGGGSSSGGGSDWGGFGGGSSGGGGASDSW